MPNPRTAVCLIVLTSLPAAVAQSGASGGEWRTYGGDLGNTHYASIVVAIGGKLPAELIAFALPGKGN